MIETILKTFLSGKLTESVYLEKPLSPPTRYVLIEKTNGNEKNQLQRATVAIQSYAESMYEAAALNERLKTAMRDAASATKIYGAVLNSDYNFTDTTKKHYRYQAVYDVSYYD